MPVTWEPIPQHTSFTLWDIDREFQQANEAYDQWQARQRRRRATWACIGMKHQDDALGRVLRLGRQVQKIMETGKELFGARFEQGDSKCHTILSAQLLRLQYEIRQPLFDSALSPAATPIDYNEIIKTAKSIRRTCLTALKEQFTRFESRNFVPLLPPPRFKVDYCPFADQLRKDLRTSKASNLRTQKLRPNDRHDDRELCPHCDACISVTAHSGLPDYRSILFTSHTALPRTATTDRATFACNSCYKSFDDSYAFLDHVFQKQIGSDRSCMRKSTYSFTSTSSFSSYEDNAESDPVLVEQCLKNCLRRELTRVRTQKKLKSQVVVTTKEVEPETTVSQLVIRNPDPEPEPTSIKSLRRSSSRPFRHQNV